MSTLGSQLKKKRDEEARLLQGQLESSRYTSVVIAETAAQVQITNVETPILHKTITLGGGHYLMVRFWGECNISTALTLTVRLYVDGVLQESSRQLCTAAGYWHFDWNPWATAGQGTRTVAIRALTSTGTATIAAGQAQLIIESRGLVGSPRPDKEAALALTLMNVFSTATQPMPVLDVASTTARTIDGANTVPDIPTVGGGWLVAYERYQTGADSYLDIYGDNWEAQTFTVGVAHDCNSLGGKMYRTGSTPGDYTFALYNTSSGLPKELLTSGTLSASALTTAAAPVLFAQSTFAAATLTTDTFAFVVYGGVDSSSSQAVRWVNDASSPTYTGGSRVYSANASSSWTADATRDFIFEEGDQK